MRRVEPKLLAESIARHPWSSLWDFALLSLLMGFAVLMAIDIVTMFASVFIITGGTPGGATETISYFIYRIGFKTFNFGYASAVSVVMLALTTVVAQLFVKRFFRSGKASRDER